MIQKTPYVAKPVNSQGIVDYTDDENSTWSTLIRRQTPIVKRYACPEYLNGLELLNLSEDRVPQLPDVDRVLKQTTGWSMHPVPALIPHDLFFKLLSEKKFPLATFIRRPEDLDYIQEPDIFHELFGHAPLLTHPAYADFTEQYGKIALTASDAEREMLARLYWFTIEFGLIETSSGMKTYGGGILSSKNETIYCIDSPVPKREALDVINVLRTPYRIDILQPIYYYIRSFDDLFALLKVDLIEKIREATSLGMFEPLFPPAESGAGNHTDCSAC